MPGINVNQITSMLAKLPDQSLQQYAAMHKDNPYIVSLAVAESNRRKDLRSAGAQQPMQPQPKVAEAAIAQMALPEELGIGALPAPNMQGMADGGIVGYADGGEVEGYQSGGIMGDMPAGFEAGRFVEPQVGSAENLPWLQRQLRVAAEAEAAGSASPQQKAVLRWAQRFGYTPETEQYPAATATRRSDYEPGYYAGKETQLPALPGQPDAAAKTDTGTKTPPAKAPAAAAPSIGTKAVSTGSVSDLGKLYNRILAQQDAADPAAKERGELAAEMTEAPKRRLQAFEEDVKKRGDVYKGREERLAQREAGLTKEKDTMAGLALLEAGLTMMGTRGTLGEAVGAGGKAGLRSYGEGLDKLRAAQAKIEESRERLEDLRINRDDLTASQRRQLQGEVDKGATEAKNLMITSIMERDKVSRAQATAIFAATMEAQMNRERIAAQLQAAQISATPQPNAQMQIALALGNGKLEEGLRKFAEIQAGKFDIRSSYSDYLKAFAGKETITPPLSLANYAAQFGATLPR